MPGLILGLLWVSSLILGGFLYLNGPTVDLSTLGEAVGQRIWAYVFLGFGAIGLMIQLGAESVLWHLNRR